MDSKWRVPILMYHSISDDPEPGVSPYYRVNTSPAIFRQHMAFLKEQGYQTISLDQLVSAFQLFSFSAFPKPVVLTFDDAFRNFYTEAFPVLKQHRFTAAMFLPTAFIGDIRRQFRPAGAKPSTLNPQPSTRLKECLTWSEVRELHAAGIEFGSHTVNHPKLVELGWGDIECELRTSKLEIEAHLGIPVRAMAYPYAFPQADRRFTSAFRDVLQRGGYNCCVTTDIGRAQTGHDAFQLPRLPVNSDDAPALLGAKLVGNYDWLGFPQAVVKKIKHAIHPARNQTDPPFRTLIPGPPAAASSPSLTTKQP